MKSSKPIRKSRATQPPCRPGMPMKIPIYFLALWASPFQIIPDHAFVNGPTVIGFNTSAFVESQPGWLRSYRVYASGKWRNGAEMVDFVATNYSINPRLLLAILEYQGGALTQPEPPVKRICLALRALTGNLPIFNLSLPPTHLTTDTMAGALEI